LRKYLHLHSVTRLGGLWAISPNPCCGFGLVLAHRLPNRYVNTGRAQPETSGAWYNGKPADTSTQPADLPDVNRQRTRNTVLWSSVPPRVSVGRTLQCVEYRDTEKLCTSTYSAY